MTLNLLSRAAVLRLLCLLAVVCAALPAWSAAPVTTTGDYIVAVVNSELVTAVELQKRIERLRADAQRAGAAVPDDATLRKQAMDSLVNERVLVTFARENGPKVDDVELDRAVSNIAAQNRLTVPQLRERLAAEGLEYARFRSNLKDQIQVERVREREVTSRIRVTDAEVDQALDEMRASLAGDVELNLAQILVTVPEGASDDIVAQRRAIAEAALARVRGGEDFARVAREVSEDPNRANGGQLGLRPLSRLPDLFVDATRGLQPGQVAPQLVRSGAGFHVLEVVDRRAAPLGLVTQTHARHILLRVSDEAPLAATVQRLEDLRRQIESGKRSFEAVAREVSEDDSAAAGGDLGWASPGTFVPEFEDAMNKLPPMGISPPVQSRFGVHLIQVLARREVTLDPKELREQVRNQLRERKFAQAYLDWTKELRLRAYIEYRDPPQ